MPIGHCGVLYNNLRDFGGGGRGCILCHCCCWSLVEIGCLVYVDDCSSVK
jgi:hypothetical protein